MTKIWWIVRTNLVRASRDRTSLFFIVLLPLILIMALGLTYAGGGAARIGLVDPSGGALAKELVDDIRATNDVAVEIRSFASIDELRDAAARGFVELGLALPADYDTALEEGRNASIEYVAPQTTKASAVRATVDRAVARQAALFRAARFAAAEGVPFEQALAAARAGQAGSSGILVATESVAEASPTAGFGTGAPSQVILFMFLTSLTGAVELITTRQLGVSRRMFATPTSAWTIIAGEGLARVAIALFQGFFIVVASSLLFGVAWPDPVATIAIVVTFSFVCGGAALLVGTIARNPSQGGSIGTGVGLLLGLLGGTMVPTEVFPEVMRTASHVTPHAWAMDAFRTLLLDGGGIAAILVPLSVLVGFAVVLQFLAVTKFRRTLLAGA